MSMTQHSKHPRDDGFTLVEVMIASAISMLVFLGMITFFISTYSYWNGVNLRMDADSDVNIAMSRLIYGMGDRLGLRAAAVESVAISQGVGGWTVNYDTGGITPQANSFTYSVAGRSLRFNPGNQIAGRDIAGAQLTLNSGVLTIRLRVDKTQGNLNASREIVTKINFRNRRN